ncbi:MAG: uridine kinase [Anaerolineae bacterium]|nr:uridine kinase [Anaerolineae bacterium]MDW8173275.1 uridine kinase [Anaerolineae bacterium]
MEDANKRPVTIGVAGGTGSGKTTVSHQILARVGSKHIAYLAHDSYYRDTRHLPSDERRRINYDHPDALETSLLIEHIKCLQNGQAVHVPVYDFATDMRLDETILVEPQPIILIEGILIFADRELRDLLDIKIFVDTDADIRFIRRLKRDMEERQRSADSVIQQYLTTVRPMHLKFVEPSKRYADVIVPEGGYNWVAIDMIADRIRSMVQGQSS